MSLVLYQRANGAVPLTWRAPYPLGLVHFGGWSGGSHGGQISSPAPETAQVSRFQVGKLINCKRRPILVHSEATELRVTAVGKLANCICMYDTVRSACITYECIQWRESVGLGSKIRRSNCSGPAREKLPLINYTPGVY